MLLVALVAAARIPGSKVGVTFDRTSADMGSIAQDGGEVRVEFVMRNPSDGAVAILSARASCGCTDPSYPKRPVMPGDSAVISVNFNPRDQRGEVTREVTLRLRNAAGKSERVNLVLTGVVVPPAR